MAPSRKKKKPASNPARGFATTSTVSKNKEQTVNNLEHPDDQGAPDQAVNDVSEVNNVSADAPPIDKPGKLLQDLGPVELELQLDASSLQILVEQYREKTKKDAFRHTSRLKTEKRLLRSQAEHLSTQQWLPREIIQLILDHYDAQNKVYEELPRTSETSRTANEAAGEDNLIARLWTLKFILAELGFSEEQTTLALRQLLKKTDQTSQNLPTSKDFIWGLEECLDWLALTSESAHLPSYLPHKTTTASQLSKDGSFLENVIDANTSNSAPTDSTPSTPLSKTTPGRQSPFDDNTSTSSEQGSDSDIGPDQQIPKYISLQSRLYDIEPALANPNRKKPKYAPPNARNIDGKGNADTDRKIARLTAKLNRIKSDILFDQEQAESIWGEHWTQLTREESERQKLGIRRAIGEGHRGLAPQTVETSESQGGNAPASADINEDAGNMLGEFFANLPDSTVDPVTGKSSMKTTNPEGLTVVVRHFGKWTGISPRRVFEDACRARDSSSRVTYKLISASTFSNRQSLEVRWSRSQEPTSSAYIDSVTCTSDRKSVKFEMVSIACPDTVQSEAYISTLALFIIFGSSPKEEKSYLRLPSTWRDFWTELSVIKKEQDDARDCEVLRELRSMINKHRRQTEANNAPSSNLEASKLLTSEPQAIETPGLQTVGVPEAMRSLWAAKASTASYKDRLSSRMTLPVWKFKDEVLEAIEQHQVVIICGETGCGKSTQVPAFILEHELLCGRPCKIYCTEPRRISAISLARRVSEELGDNKGEVGTLRSLVGYAIRLESQVTAQTRLVYATTGIVMRMLEKSDDLGEITHLVLDEVHERTIDSDFFLIVLRKLLVKRPELKVILMSATVDAQRFSNYLGRAPILIVPGRTFPVITKYLEDAIELTNFKATTSPRDDGYFEDEDGDDEITIDSSSKTTLSADNLKFYSENTCNALLKFDESRVNYNLIIKLLETIATSEEYAVYSNAILVFLPGIAEIKRLNDSLICHRLFTHRWYIYALHSTIATEEQERAFLVPPPGYRKIVLATNIAETGITIPDVTCVIDTGKHKEMRFDERRQLSRLIEVHISRANAKQRRGRAGRVQKGLCFHLFTKNRYDNIMAEEQQPEMLRLSLQDLVLRVKTCKLGGIEQTLLEALDPPSAKNIRRAIDSLIDVRALTVAEDLTPLGRQLARLPLDVFLGKLILLGAIFGCLDAMLTVAAMLSSKSPFSAPMGSRSQADAARLAFKKGDSDLLTVYNAYCAWRRICISNAMPEYQFCRKNFLNPRTLSNIEDLKAQLAASLADAGFMRLEKSEISALNRVRFYAKKRSFVEVPARYNNNSYGLMINTVIACSFYPKLLKREGKGWRNIANNQSVSLHPTSVNKGGATAARWLSFYHIMQSSNKFYNAHETSPAEDYAVAIVCGEAEFKMYSGVMVIDNNRIRFSVDDWKTLLATKILRTEIRRIMAQSFRYPGRSLSSSQQGWLDIWQKILYSNSSDKI